MTAEMTQGRQATVPEWFWRLAAAADHRLLMLDYDGTLAPFRAARQEAVLSPDCAGPLRAIAASSATRVAIVSGRPVGELRELLGPLDLILVGEHGWEELWPGSVLVRHPVPSAAEALLESAAEAAAREGHGPRLERKRTALVLHTRGLSGLDAARVEAGCEALWKPLVVGSGLELTPTHGGLELRIHGRDKGTAVRDILARSPQGSLPVYLGDDGTDEDAFNEIGARGFTLRVGQAARTAAWGRIDSVAEVPVFLRKWLSAVERTEIHGRPIS